MINRNYTILLLAFTLSSIGDWLSRLAVPILIFQLSGSAMDMAIANALVFLPFLLVSPFGGVIADRVERRRVLIYGDLSAFVIALLLAVAASYVKNPSPLYLLIFLMASISPLYHTSFQSIIPSLVKSEDLGKANSYIQSSDNVMTLLGPLLGGGIVAFMGPTNAIYVDAASFLISGLLVTGIHINSAELGYSKGLGINSIVCDLKTGFSYAWRNPIVKYGSLLFLFSNFAIGTYYANFMFHLLNILHLSPFEIGYTLAISGIGAIIGSLSAPYIAKRFNEGRLILVCTILAGLSALPLLYADKALFVAIAWGTVSALDSIIIVTYFTLRQRVVPLEFLGRAVGITRLIAYSSIPVASVFGGWLLEKTHHIETLIVICAVTMILTGCLGWLTPLNTPSSIRAKPSP
jgi:MFS family permease